MSATVQRREQLGLEISRQIDAVRRINERQYQVKSQSDNVDYQVNPPPISLFVV